jgi:endonuclease YncB( thermonuclease family)
MNNKSLRHIKKQVKLVLTLASFIIFLFGASIKLYYGDDIKKLDGSISSHTQLGQVANLETINLGKALGENAVSGDFAKVIKVVDGDTITIQKDIYDSNSKVTLRLIGMNTPETVDPRKKVQCFGKEATKKAKEMLLGKMVRVEYDKTQSSKDKYGRDLAYIYVPEQQTNSVDEGVYTSETKSKEILFNKFMIKSGYAFEYTYDKPYAYQSEFKEAEKYAKQKNLGLWSPGTCDGRLQSVSN